MADVITVSSDEEDSPPSKKPKPTILIGLKGITITPIPKTNGKSIKLGKENCQENIVVLSDDEDLNSSLIFDKDVSLTNNNNSKSQKNVPDNYVIIDDAEDCETEAVVNTKKSIEKEEISGSCLIIDDVDNCETTSNKKCVLEKQKVCKLDVDKPSVEDDCEIIEDSPNTLKIEEKCSRKNTDKENISENISQSLNNSKEADCIVLQEFESNTLSSDDNSKNDSTAENVNDLAQPSTSTSNSEEKPPQTVLLENFINICEQNVKDSQYTIVIEKIPVLLRFYKKCESSLGYCTDFKQLLVENIEKAQCSAARSVICFKEVFQYIKDVVNVKSVEVPEQTRIKLKKFEKTIKLLTKHIHRLENAEVNFDDEEDSTYLQLDRYTNRLKKIYEKYCQLLKKNPNYGRITYAKLDFVASDYNEINRAICKKYKNNKVFPSYYEMETFIRRIVEEQNLQLNEAKIKLESSYCFKKLGELLQNRRKRELYDTHYDYIKDNSDPATDDQPLKNQLNDNYKQGQKNIDKLCEEYVVKQELGEEANLSEEDSDNSGYVDSEDEDKNNSEEEKKEVENVQEDP